MKASLALVSRAFGLLIALLTCACGTQPTSVKYDLTGTWFRSGGPSEGGACFPREQRNHDVTRNYWVVTRGPSGITAKDDGGCTLALTETDAGVLEGDGATCTLEEGKPLALLGITRRYVRFRLDASKQTFAAGMIDRYLTNTGELVGCGLVEATTKAVTP